MFYAATRPWYGSRAMKFLAGSVLAAGSLLAVASGWRSAASAPPPAPAPAPAAPGIEAPRGMVAFFDGNCPPGWAVATVVAGRLLVGTDRADTVGRVVGEPLAAEEDRAHDHGLSAATISLPSKAIAAADGGNNNGAAAGAQPLIGTVEAAPSGLPFVQLTTCVVP